MTYICTIAQRVSDVAIFSRPAQQSDYLAAWKRLDHVDAPKQSDYVEELLSPSTSEFSIRKLIPRPLRRIIRKSINMIIDALVTPARPFDRPYYKRLSANDLIRANI